MRTQIYLPAAWFNLIRVEEPAPTPPQPIAPQPDIEAPSESVWLTGLGTLGLLGALLCRCGWQTPLDGQSAAGDSLGEPRLDTSKTRSFDVSKGGKVCHDLRPTEVAFYLGLPFKRIVSALINSFEGEGFLEIASRNPFRGRILRSPDLDRLDTYERMLWESFTDDGELSQAELEDLTNTAVDNVPRKAWDCDVEATKPRAKWRSLSSDGGRPRRPDITRRLQLPIRLWKKV